MDLPSRIRALRKIMPSRAVAAVLDIELADVVTVLNAGEFELPATGGSGLPEGGDVGEVVTNTAPGEGTWASVEVPTSEFLVVNGVCDVAAAVGGGDRWRIVIPQAPNIYLGHTAGLSIDGVGRIVGPLPCLYDVKGTVAFASVAGAASADIVRVTASVTQGGQIGGDWGDTFFALSEQLLLGEEFVISFAGLVPSRELNAAGSQYVGGPLRLWVERTDGFTPGDFISVQASVTVLPWDGVYEVEV